MPLYEWQGRDALGRPQRGTVYAETPQEALERVKEEGVQPTLLRPIEARVHLPLGTRIRGATPGSLSLFFRNLHQGVRAGVLLTDLLETIGNSSSPFAFVARYAAKRVAKGVPFSQALAETGFPFPPFVLPFIRAGERSGKLDEAFGYLAEYFEQEHQGWLLYRVSSLGCVGCPIGCLVPTLLFILFILPSIMQSVSPDPQWALQFHQRLFGPMRYLLWGLGVFVGLMLLNYGISRHPSLGGWWENLKMRLPLLGASHRWLAVARFGRVLAMLHSAGLSPAESLVLAGQASGNPAIARAARQQAQLLKRGEPFSKAVSAIPYLPPAMIQAIAVGEQTGSLDEGLKKAVEMLEREAQTTRIAKAFALPLLVSLLITLALGALIFLAWRALLGLYTEFLNWSEF